MRRRIVLVLAGVILGFAVEPSLAGTVYHTSVGNSYNEFWAYDTATDVWTRKNDFQTGSTLAVDSSGNVFAYSSNRTAILKYDPVADVWDTYLAAPVLGGSNPDGFFNLEVTETGRFLLTGNTLPFAYFSDGGAWSSALLGFQTNATGDYDPATGQYAVTPLAGTSPKLIDTNTFAVTSFSGSGSGSDWRRSGTILDGYYFIQTANEDVEMWDLSDPTAEPIRITSTPVDLQWMASAADRENGYLYAADVYSGTFYRYDGTSWTRLATVGVTTISVTTIAFVPDAMAVPEPHAMALLGFGAIGLAVGVARKRGRRKR